MGLYYCLLMTSWGYVGTVFGPAGIRKLVLPRPNATEVLMQLESGRHDIRQGEGDCALNRKIQDYFNGKRVDFSEKLDLDGYSIFNERVWELTRKIGYGQTISYGQISEQLGKPGGSRAVGQALARNPVPIIIPCHRVVRADGSPGGFSGGISIKIRLLELETYPDGQ